MGHGEQDAELRRFFSMHDDISEIIRLSRKCLSQEAYSKVLHIIECEFHCIIDIDIGAETGPEGQSYSEENSNKISSMLSLLPFEDN